MARGSWKRVCQSFVKPSSWQGTSGIQLIREQKGFMGNILMQGMIMIAEEITFTAARTKNVKQILLRVMQGLSIINRHRTSSQILNFPRSI